MVVVRLDACKDRLQRVAHTFCTKRMVQKTKTAEVRARSCQVDNGTGRAARQNCYGSLGLTLPSSHNSLSGGSVRRHCQLGMDVLEKQQAWYKTYGATLCSRSLHASSRRTTKAAPHTQCDGCRLLYGYNYGHTPSAVIRVVQCGGSNMFSFCFVFSLTAASIVTRASEPPTPVGAIFP